MKEYENQKIELKKVNKNTKNLFGNMKEYENQQIEINLDFDGTCVTHDYPRVGANIGSVKVLKRLVNKGHKLILFTMRSEKNNSLIDAIEWFGIHEIPLYGIQSSPIQLKSIGLQVLKATHHL